VDPDPRPLRRYEHTFIREGVTGGIILPAIGRSPCLAKNQAFELLEAYLKTHPDLPPSDWRLIRQNDIGLVE